MLVHVFIFFLFKVVKRLSQEQSHVETVSYLATLLLDESPGGNLSTLHVQVAVNLFFWNQQIRRKNKTKQQFTE